MARQCWNGRRKEYGLSIPGAVQREGEFRTGHSSNQKRVDLPLGRLQLLVEKLETGAT